MCFTDYLGIVIMALVLLGIGMTLLGTLIWITESIAEYLFGGIRNCTLFATLVLLTLTIEIVIILTVVMLITGKVVFC